MWRLLMWCLLLVYEELFSMSSLNTFLKILFLSLPLIDMGFIKNVCFVYCEQHLAIVSMFYFPKHSRGNNYVLYTGASINDVQDQVLLNRGDAVSQTLRPEHNVRLCRQHHELYSSKECTAWFQLMAWNWTDSKPLPETMMKWWPCAMMHICLTRFLFVNQW